MSARGLLDRKLEALPADSVILERDMRGGGLTRPELAVLMAYAKIALRSEIVASDVPDDPYLSRELRRYFPKAMQERFAEEIDNHRLRREIIATMLANSMINRGGPSFVALIARRDGGEHPPTSPPPLRWPATASIFSTWRPGLMRLIRALPAACRMAFMPICSACCAGPRSGSCAMKNWETALRI